jgi:hypothetical protein
MIGVNVQSISEPSVSIAVHELDAARVHPGTWANPMKPVFLVSLWLCTWLPMGLLPLSSGLEGSMFGYAGTRTLLLFPRNGARAHNAFLLHRQRLLQNHQKAQSKIHLWNLLQPCDSIRVVDLIIGAILGAMDGAFRGAGAVEIESD